MQEVRRSQYRDLRDEPAWSINSGKMESRTADFPDFRCLRAAATSSDLKELEILFPSGVGIFHRLESPLLTSLMDPRLPVLCAPFFRNCEAMEFAKTGHRREERSDLPVSLLMVLHTLQLECEKAMELTASSNRSCFFCSIRESRGKAALSDSGPVGSQRKEQ